jgi:hypothetical protein
MAMTCAVIVIAVALGMLHAQPALAGQTPATRWSAPPTTLVEAQERIFHSGTVQLSGTLHVPKVEGRVPAIPGCR